MGRPFEVEIDIGGQHPIRFTIDEDRLKSATDIGIYTAVQQQGPDDTDERRRLLRGAMEVVRRLLEKNAADPLRIFDGPDVWMIPDHAIRAVKLLIPNHPISAAARRLGSALGPVMVAT